jgi:hypothetical protein
LRPGQISELAAENLSEMLAFDPARHPWNILTKTTIPNKIEARQHDIRLRFVLK